jgi:hypothetical protein
MMQMAEMTIDRLEQFRSSKKEIKELENKIANLNGTDGVVSDIVKASYTDYPYIEHHLTVTGVAKGYTNSKDYKIAQEYKTRKKAIENEVYEIEKFISSLPHSDLRRIIEARYIDGRTWAATASRVYGYPNADRARMAVNRFFEKEET